MSKEGLPSVNAIDAEGMRVAVVSSMWNSEICAQLRRTACETARAHGAIVESFEVVGALEIPVVAQKLAASFDAVVALGCVIRGGTPHFDYVCDSVTQGLTRIALDTSTPIGNGILTVDTQQQAIDRAGFPDSTEDKGTEAMIAALHTAHVLRSIV
ncbi:6,7-dimethyl-8-ribityllumazine synthase [Corynebacterium sp. sy017]|uniref:6,7-dimethyl-8-ribityllumazine synthase n=1 Tax=unclassified Corynebacterium TaxID=2624378 RepID=UPI001186434B|nr:MULTISPECIES: 6,7-dimethyl-8-ribityllumazine synthase [unclassified Corynebacterium]MBP3087671.1 6,7-dimethyl-8-ribityllumazine synthase [Corynebacterium sp. sy017]QDZ42659.1 6,7-dimethyl-8-ribityllumazine synthase [Corynebacterium sp. sy039]TSD92233.1 6,7-dimethyl-8-ribityllumazine synthase [Corynebacterium sp. SY003]